jgi:hypothetical protein
MALLLIEALGAGLLFIGIIWWTMFSGRPNGEAPGAVDAQQDKQKKEHAKDAQNGKDEEGRPL